MDLSVFEAYGVKVKVGGHVYCPFPDHKDDTKSFWVHPQKKYWKCFGCNRWGYEQDFVFSLHGKTLKREPRRPSPPKGSPIPPESYRTLKHATGPLEVKTDILVSVVNEYLYPYDYPCRNRKYGIRLSPDRSIPTAFREILYFISDRIPYNTDPGIMIPALRTEMEAILSMEPQLVEQWNSDTVYSLLTDLSSKCRALSDPFAVGIEEVSRRHAAVANTYLAVEDLRIATYKYKSRVQREKAILEAQYDRKIAKATMEMPTRGSTKDERRAIASSHYADEARTIINANSTLEEIKDVLSCIDTTKYAMRMILDVTKNQLISLAPTKSSEFGQVGFS